MAYENGLVSLTEQTAMYPCVFTIPRRYYSGWPRPLFHSDVAKRVLAEMGYKVESCAHCYNITGLDENEEMVHARCVDKAHDLWELPDFCWEEIR